MKKYVIGFAFSHLNEVILIRKNKPEWQRNLLNGVGGHVEDGEELLDAMVREFEEETGHATKANQWRRRLVLRSNEFELFVYKATLSIHDFGIAETVTDEKIYRVEVPLSRDLIEGTNGYVPNLCWMVPLLMDRYVSISNVQNFDDGAMHVPQDYYYPKGNKNENR